MKEQKFMVVILYNFSWDYYICNTYNYRRFIRRYQDSNLNDVINANVAQIHTLEL